MNQIPTQLSAEQRSLVERNMGLAQHLALITWRRNPGVMDKDEIVAVAYEGLVKAAVRFDPSRANVDEDGVADIAGAFAGYARQKISGAILDWQKGADHVPRRQRTTYKRLEALGHGAGRSREELASLSGLPVEQVTRVIAAVEHLPISLTVDPRHGEAAESAAESPEWDRAEDSDIESTALESRIRLAVVEVFDGLNDLERLVIALRYYENMDLTVIAQTLEISPTAVRAAHTEALLLIHTAMLKEAR